MKAPIPVPFPKHFSAGESSVPFVVVPAVSAPKDFLTSAQALASYIKRIFGTDIAVREDDVGIRMIYAPELENEKYRFVSEGGEIYIYASCAAGFSHGGSVLLQTAEACDGLLVIPDLTVEDEPDVFWRGLMVDLARADYPLEDIIKFADICYFYRLSILHLHFADGPCDFSFKLPLPHFPELDRGHGYSTEQVEYIKKYLADRGIMLLPEIEMPAHALPLVTHAKDKFGCHGDTICPGHPGIFDQLDRLIGDVCDLFPDSPYIHIGCDEAYYPVWDDCPECRAFMEKEGIPSSAALYSYTVARCTRIVLEHGRTPIVWEGFPKDGTGDIPKETVVMVFQSTYQNARQLTEQGFRVINTSWQPLYVVPSIPKYWKPSDIYRWRYDRWFLEDDVNEENPIDVEDKRKDMVLGAQICLWEGSKFDADGQITEENLAAISERLWNSSPMANRPYSEFAEAKKLAAEKLLKLL